jgi:hypothetical protein
VPDTTGADSLRPHYRSFTIAEIFQFELERSDSARVHLEAIVADTLEDTAHTRRAYYALAWLEGEAGQKARSDSLYQVILKRYPETEWAKQAERNLGLPSTVQTPNDKAHALFLEAERLRFAGENLNTRVIPAYREVVRLYPATPDAAQALFVTAFLREEIALTPPGSQVAIDSAKAAYEAIRKDYPNTLYAERAADKLQAVDESTSTGGGRGDVPSEEEGEDSEESDRPVRELVDPKGEEDLY